MHNNANKNLMYLRMVIHNILKGNWLVIHIKLLQILCIVQPLKHNLDKIL